ncbi:hypothetical protein IW261DRAFT_1413804 [Armillaria novae-zelandiae]|uniref:NAD(P)-binding domain-containing protein n=1 Tax=Armillaria novae-zelandiae TaxID=153914 RepID=A0AA39PYK9_9AGAR|nr:hypothetical protein IW261DRAFT_1413804 [Armillaria novae-zelandiae]
MYLAQNAPLNGWPWAALKCILLRRFILPQVRVMQATRKRMYDGNKPFLVASRSGGDPTDKFPSCRFDWLDISIYAIPWSKVEEMTSVYLVPPLVPDMLSLMKAFIDYSREKRDERFVLLSASVVEPGGPAAGKVHEHLARIDVEYCVLRPTWFMEDLGSSTHYLEYEQYRKPIKLAEDNIYSTTGDGKALFVFAGILGRKITHVKLTQLEMASLFYGRNGHAKRIAKGMEVTLNSAVLRITGRPPIRFSTYVKSVRHAWE